MSPDPADGLAADGVGAAAAPHAAKTEATRISAPTILDTRNGGRMADRVPGRPQVGRALEWPGSQDRRGSGTVEGA